MTPVPPVIAEAPLYRDRSSGLKGFGILLIILGGLCALFAMVACATMMTKAPSGTTGPLRLFLPSLTYGALAIALIWLGVGSFHAQRWARTLTMLMSWGMLYLGILVVAVVLCLFHFNSPATPPQSGLSTSISFFGMVFAVTLLGMFFVILPAILGWFYSRPEVKATCEDLHPEASWTDACPPAVLMLCLWHGLSAVSTLILPFNRAIPFFGEVLSGSTALLICLVQAGLLGFSAWFLYRLKPAGWWLALGLSLFSAFSRLLNMLNLDFNKLYQTMGYDEAHIQQLQQSHYLQVLMGVGLVAGFLPIIILLGYTRRYYFRAAATAPTPSEPPPTYL